MKFQRIIANKIFQIRQEIDIDGNEKRDWYLAQQYIEQHGKEKFDDDNLYIWFLTKGLNG